MLLLYYVCIYRQIHILPSNPGHPRISSKPNPPLCLTSPSASWRKLACHGCAALFQGSQGKVNPSGNRLVVIWGERKTVLVWLTSIWLMLNGLVGGWPTPLKNISQWKGASHILWKIKNVPNHQPVVFLCGHLRFLRTFRPGSARWCDASSTDCNRCRMYFSVSCGDCGSEDIRCASTQSLEFYGFVWLFNIATENHHFK